MTLRLPVSAWETLLLNGACAFLDWKDITRLLTSNRTIHCLYAPHWDHLEGASHFLHAFVYRKQALENLLHQWLDSLAMVMPLFATTSFTPLQIWRRIGRLMARVLLEGATTERSLRHMFQHLLRPEALLRWCILLQLPIQINEHLRELPFQYRVAARNFGHATNRLTPLWVVLPMLDYVSHQTVDLLSRL